MGRSHDGPGREVEGDAEHVRVLDVEDLVFVEVVGLPAKRPADDLLAEELSTKCAYSEHVGHGVGVPTLRQHRDGDDAAGFSAEPSGLADRVHGLAKQVLVG